MDMNDSVIDSKGEEGEKDRKGYRGDKWGWKETRLGVVNTQCLI